MKIKIQGEAKEIDYQPQVGQEKSLWELLIEKNIEVGGTCSGRGTCGKCKCKLYAQDKYPLTKAEQHVLLKAETDNNIRLACQVKPRADMTIGVLHKEANHRILSTGFTPDVALQPALGKQVFTLAKPTLADAKSYEQLLMEALQITSVPYKILKSITPGQETYTAVYNHHELLAIEAGDTSQQLYGITVDIGTTSVAVTLVDLLTGKQLGSEVDINKQTAYGADVLTRISYVLTHKEKGLNSLQRAIVGSLNKMISTICELNAVDSRHIYEVSVAANTTMNHLLMGIDPSSLGRAPYVPIMTAAQNIAASELGLRHLAVSARVQVLPAVSSFVGSDVVAGVLAAGIYQSAGRSLLIDVGTNCEIILADAGQMIGCSCAAGPALEGMNISSGMKAADGAIEEIDISAAGVTLQVIGDKSPQGICGSGILAAIREFLKTGLITSRGRIIDPESLAASDYRKKLIIIDENNKRALQLVPNIVVTQNDIRQVQLAKGAILAGIETLLSHSGFTAADIGTVVVAGQFGSHISEASLTGTGLLPIAFGGKITYIGNSSHSGAYLSQISLDSRQVMADIAKQIDYIELSVTDGYERLFAKSSQFPKITE